VPARPSMSSSSAAAVLPMDRTVAASRLDAQKRYVVGWLVALSGSTRGESYPVRMGRNVIGRDRKSDIVISDDQASSHHADLVFRPEEKRFILMDHNSTNGTYVNELEIEPRRDLAPKDVIRIGSHRFIFTPLCHDGFHWDDEGPLK
jgi:pSer/pThr/pTyr-binding forkhead associated (FHA) protein